MVEQCADLRKSIAALALTFNSCSSSAAAIWETARAAGGLPGQQQCPPASVAFVRCFHEFHQSLPLLQATNAGLTNRKAQARFPFEPVFGLSFEICRVSVSGSCRSTFAVRQTRHSPCGRRGAKLAPSSSKGRRQQSGAPDRRHCCFKQRKLVASGLPPLFSDLVMPLLSHLL